MSNITSFLVICREDDSEPEMRLLRIATRYPRTFIQFGYPETTSYLLQEVDTQRFQIWVPQKWTHLCISFQKRDMHIRIVKVIIAKAAEKALAEINNVPEKYWRID